MADDLVINVKQISQYAQTFATGPSDRALIQQGGLGGPYASIAPSDFISTALSLGGFVNLAPGGSGGIAFNGAALVYNDGAFVFTEGVTAPLVSASEMFVNGAAVADQIWVQGLFDSIALNFVSSFNGRGGAVQLEVEDVMRAGAAPIWSPHFGGHVTAPTSWNLQGHDDTVATLAWVQEWARCSGNLVHTFNGRGGDVILSSDDITSALTVPGVYAMANTPPSGDTSKRIATTAFVDDACFNVQQWAIGQFTTYSEIFGLQYAPINSPNFTGIPTAPTANLGTSTGQLATTAFVAAAVTASTTGVATFNGRTGDVTLITSDITNAGGAPIVSPIFGGSPACSTAPVGTSSAVLANTEFVMTAIADITVGVESFNTRTGAVVLTTADVTGVGGAPIASPVFSGIPMATTAAPGTNTGQLATCAFVQNALSNVTAGVSSFNGRTGAVSLLGADVSAAGGALINSPALTGSPTAPTATPGNSSTLIATTAFVQAAVGASTAGVTSFNGRTGAVVFGSGDITAAGGALLAGPTFTGIPAAPTAAPNTNTTQIATTAFVAAAIAQAPGGVSSFNTRTGAITLNSGDISAAGGALINSPTFTGTPAAPTQTPGTNNTSLATTAFVAAAMATAGGVISFNGRAGTVTLNGTDIAGAGGALMTVATNPPTGPAATANQAFWWDNVGGQLYLNYNDGNSTQWVPAAAPAQGQVQVTSGNKVLVASAVVTSAQATVDLFYAFNNPTYDVYELVFYGVQTSALAAIYMRLSIDGSTFDTSALYAYSVATVSAGNNSTSTASGTYSGMVVQAVMSQQIQDSATTAGSNGSGKVELYNFGTPALLSNWTVHGGSRSNANGWMLTLYAGFYNNVGATIQGIRFYPASGNFIGGTFKLYGIVK